MTPTEPWGGVYWHTNTVLTYVTWYKHSRPKRSHVQTGISLTAFTLFCFSSTKHVNKDRRGWGGGSLDSRPSAEKVKILQRHWNGSNSSDSLLPRLPERGGERGSDERIFRRPPTGVNIPLQDKRGSSRDSLSVPLGLTEKQREGPISPPEVHLVKGYSPWKGSPTWAEGLWSERQAWERRQNLKHTHKYIYMYMKRALRETRNRRAATSSSKLGGSPGIPGLLPVVPAEINFCSVSGNTNSPHRSAKPSFLSPIYASNQVCHAFWFPQRLSVPPGQASKVWIHKLWPGCSWGLPLCQVSQ